MCSTTCISCQLKILCSMHTYKTSVPSKLSKSISCAPTMDGKVESVTDVAERANVSTATCINKKSFSIFWDEVGSTKIEIGTHGWAPSVTCKRKTGSAKGTLLISSHHSALQGAVGGQKNPGSVKIESLGKTRQAEMCKCTKTHKDPSTVRVIVLPSVFINGHKAQVTCLWQLSQK